MIKKESNQPFGLGRLISNNLESIEEGVFKEGKRNGLFRIIGMRYIGRYSFHEDKIEYSKVYEKSNEYI